MLSGSIRIMEVALAGVLCAVAIDQWLSRGIYFHAFEATVRAAGRAITG